MKRMIYTQRRKIPLAKDKLIEINACLFIRVEFLQFLGNNK